ncbi:MAG: copper resistance system multicopper oxidase [Phenylobacterium sp.]|uniref:copper resistance system multicopper oxidase n=1 Tax=Phenylobacterium sp. TaxID=1871053 RepID=UPI0025D1BD73|nr:copper resistance system multicopper oxidase [Phenylobacterium sp.]MBI1198891.1 copper resistance system multicopper oxidase [Phenylobacterium sp.]
MRPSANALDRRHLLRAAAALGGGGALSALLPAWARAQAPGATAPAALSGDEIALAIGHAPLSVDGRAGHAVAINGSVPGPLIRLKEGRKVRIAVTNHLDEDTSIHWHGVLVPFQMDGVPGLSFPGIKPGETFVYEFTPTHAGTYWFHSHSGLQELVGHYAPLIIDPAGDDPVACDREHVVVLSDYSFMHPHKLIEKLKQQSGYFNRQKQTVAGLLAGQDQPLAERMEWARMRMDPTDILDVGGATYSYLANGHGPADNWTGLFRPGERVRLRFVNAGAMTIFNVRIPGLPMTVVQADGQDVQPIEVDEFQIANAETFDVVVTPRDDRAYSLIAEAADGSGRARATLAPRPGMSAEVPPLRPRPVLTMRDMGMDMSGHGDMQMDMSMLNPANAPQVKLGPGVQMIAPMPVDRTGERGTGLAEAPGRVLVYTDLVALRPNPDPRPPSRSLEVHLTGNMERFMWSFDGVKYSDRAEPIPFRLNERVRVTLVNDTMMNHPIHLHGHFFELVNGHDGRLPRKHTVNVMPGGRATFDLTADAPGDWAFHCHMLLHMHAGMFRVVTVRPLPGEAA